MHSIQFAPECFAETEMVRILFDDLINRNVGFINHGDGIHSVSNILKKKDVENYRNIGFIDNDKKNVPNYFNSFSTIDELPSVSFKKHVDTQDYIMIAKPAIEGFILSQLQEIDKQPSHYGLPNDSKQFRHKLKKIRIQYNDEYKRMIHDLKNRNTSGVSFILKNISGLL
jgi:hypothetical protein